MTRQAWLVALGVGLTMAYGAYQFWDTPERQIRSVLDDVAAVMTHEKPDSGLTAAAAVAGLQAHLAPEITIDTGRPLGVLSGAQDVVASAARVRVVTMMMRVEFVDVQVSVTGDTSATVHATVKVTTQDGTGAPAVDAREISASFRRLEGRWVVAEVRQIPVLEPVA